MTNPLLETVKIFRDASHELFVSLTNASMPDEWYGSQSQCQANVSAEKKRIVEGLTSRLETLLPNVAKTLSQQTTLSEEMKVRLEDLHTLSSDPQGSLEGIQGALKKFLIQLGDAVPAVKTFLDTLTP